MQNVVSQIIAHRKKIGMTQEKFAEPLGVTGGAISALEKGRSFNVHLIRKIEEVYSIGLNLNELPAQFDSNPKKSTVSMMDSILNEYREREKSYQEQIRKLTDLLALHLGKSIDVIGGEFGPFSVTNSVTSWAKAA